MLRYVEVLEYRCYVAHVVFGRPEQEKSPRSFLLQLPADQVRRAMDRDDRPDSGVLGRNTRHRLNRGGNRRLNAAVHRIAIARARVHDGARRYLEHRKAMGNSRTEAIRALKRHLARHVYRLLVTAPQRLTTLTAASGHGDPPLVA